MIWAVVTNRTLLWKYYDSATCERVGKRYDSGICAFANNEVDCADLVDRASWLPSYDDWCTRLKLTDTKKVSRKQIGLEFARSARANTTSSIHMVDSLQHTVIEFPQMLGQDAKILRQRKIRNLLQSNDANERAAALFRDMSSDYLYGFFFHELFRFRQSTLATYPMQWNGTQWTKFNRNATVLVDPSVPSTFIVLHSRHTKPDDDGFKVNWEKKCIQQMLEEQARDSEEYSSLATGEGNGSEQRQCALLVLSDRQRTIDQLAQFAHPHCDVLVASHEKGNSWKIEHGEFAGVGFFQDLWTVQNMAKSFSAHNRLAFIGHKHRSSSSLIRELFTFHGSTVGTGEDKLRAVAACYAEEIKS